VSWPVISDGVKPTKTNSGTATASFFISDSLSSLPFGEQQRTYPYYFSSVALMVGDAPVVNVIVRCQILYPDFSMVTE
jgi:hypothetical protein